MSSQPDTRNFNPADFDTTDYECSGCDLPVQIDLTTLLVTMEKPSNTVRGAGHVPAHKVTTSMMFWKGYFQWDCPVCGYPESLAPSEG